MSPRTTHATAPFLGWWPLCVCVCVHVCSHIREVTHKLCRRPHASLVTEWQKAAQWPEKPAAHHLHPPGITAWIRAGWKTCELRDYLTIQEKRRKKEKPFPDSLSLISHSLLCFPMPPCFIPPPHPTPPHFLPSIGCARGQAVLWRWGRKAVWLWGRSPSIARTAWHLWSKNALPHQDQQRKEKNWGKTVA